MKAAFYEKKFQEYVSSSSTVKQSLSSFCKAQGISYRGLLSWRERNGISLPKFRELSGIPSPPFAPIAILPPRSTEQIARCVSAAGLLRGVKISFANGVNILIKEISVEAMTGIIHTIHSH